MNARNILIAVALAVVALSTADGACISTNGLVSWWRGESNALDSVSAHNGTLGSGVAFASGQIGSAFQFDGTDSAECGISLGDVGDFNFPPNSNFTFSVWFNSVGSPTGDGQIILTFNYGCVASETSQSLGVSRGLSNHVFFQVRDVTGVSSSIITPQPVLLNTFHHAVGVREVVSSSKRLLLYLDGELVGTAVDPTSSPLATSIVGDLIGRRNICTDYAAFHGLIDEVMIYNRALSADEVASLHVTQGGRPRLVGARVGGAVQLSWPACALDFHLEWMDDLRSSGWQPATNDVQTVGSSAVVLDTLAAPKRYYRLSK